MLLIDNRREKLINIIAYFVNNTEDCDTRKLYTMLYLLDMEHYRQTGRSCTGLTYYAEADGPVPRELDNEIQGIVRRLAYRDAGYPLGKTRRGRKKWLARTGTAHVITMTETPLCYGETPSP